MIVILTQKPGQFRTEPGEGMRVLEAYDYLFCGRLRAQYLLAEMTAPTRVRVVEESGPAMVNWVPTKFLKPHDSLAAARRELQQLCAFGRIDTELRPRAVPVPAAGAGQGAA